MVDGDTRMVPYGGQLCLSSLLTPLCRGAYDPGYRTDSDGSVWWATRNLAGSVLVWLRPQPSSGRVVVQAWGAGAAQMLAGAPDLLGAADVTAAEFHPLPEHAALVVAHRRMAGWRMPRTGVVWPMLVPAVLEQQVTGLEAHRAWRALVLAYGEPAPGPAAGPGGPAAGMMVPPDAATWAQIPVWEYRQAGVDGARHRTLLKAAAVSGRLEATVGDPGPQAAVSLRQVPGVGVWTAAEILQRAHGDPDAFSWQDYHVAKNVTWALTGEALDDAACAELLEPYRGHRYRVQRLLSMAGFQRPRRGPRMTIPTHGGRRHR